jgi:predicted small lipoprotein YifL
MKKIFLNLTLLMVMITLFGCGALRPPQTCPTYSQKKENSNKNIIEKTTKLC